MVVQALNGAAGTIYSSVKMTNISSEMCVLSGYPGMQLLSAPGSPLPTKVVRGGHFPTTRADVPPAPIQVGPGQVVQFSFSYPDNPVGSETSCPASTKVEITPPNDYTYAVVTAKLSPCDGGTIDVSPVYRGS
jgi:hypothetical protein